MLSMLDVVRSYMYAALRQLEEQHHKLQLEKEHLEYKKKHLKKVTLLVANT